MFSDSVFVYPAVMRSYARVIYRLAAGLLLLVPGLSLTAQSTEVELKARLVNKPLFLRDRWFESELNFSAQGALQQPSKKVALTLAGVDVSDVQLSATGLTIVGKRVGILFGSGSLQRVELQPLTIKVAEPADGDFAPAIRAIFAEDLSDMDSSAPSYWQQYLSQHFPPRGTANGEKKLAKSAERKRLELEEIQDPDFLKLGRSHLRPGFITIGIDVDPTGHPENVTISKPLGMGADEAMLVNVLKSSFKPAMQNGVAVRYHFSLETKFEVE